LTDSRAFAFGEHSTNLPAPFASFVGRERQIKELGHLLAAHRLVTLVGVPGVGKTRLAVQLADQIRRGFADGAWMVDLAYVDHLDDRFRLLARGRASNMPRHDTLRSLVDWSHDLLSVAERIVFRRVAVFAGGWTLEAAEAVAGDGSWVIGGGTSETGRPTPNAHSRSLGGSDAPSTLDVLGQLVDKSLVVVDEQPAALRYRFHETIRHYALDRMEESGEATEIRRLHAAHCLTLAEDAQPRLFGAELRPLLEILEREHENVRLALRWSIDAGEVDVGARLAGSLWRFWQVRGYLREGRSWLERLLPMMTPSAPTSSRARALNAIGFLAFLQGDYETGLPLLTESVEMWRTLGGRPGLVESLTNLGVLLRCVDDKAPARSCFEEAIAISRDLGDRAWEGRTLNKLARLTYYEGDLPAARALHEAGIAAVRQAGNDWDVAIALGDMADVSHALGDDAATRQLYAESLRRWVELGDERGIAQGLEGFAILAGADGRPARTVRLIGTAQAIRERITEPNSPSRRASLARLLGAARADLGNATYDAVRADGCAAPPAEAVALALGDGDTSPAAAASPAGPTTGLRIISRSPGDTTAAPSASAMLSEREREVVALVSRGFTNRQIAEALVVSERTAEWHVANIRNKLGLTSRTQLAVWARDHKIAGGGGLDAVLG
jgi:non-specific serine/threonine protein kinase